MDEKGDPAFNNAKGVEWLNLLNSFQQAGATEFNGNRDLEWFKTGKIGFVIGGTWDRYSLAQAVGAQNLSIDPWPSVGSRHLSGFLRTDNLYLNSNITGDERYAALQVMSFFLARQIQPILTRAGQVPALMDVPVNDTFTQQIMQAMKGATAYPIQPEVQAYWGPLEMAMTSVFDGSATPADALKKADADVRQQLPNFRP
jgi:maltose-binding protein MalE